jgi:hypothetical protein
LRGAQLPLGVRVSSRVRGAHISLAAVALALFAAPASGHVTASLSSEVEAGPALTSDGAVFATHGSGGWHVKLLAGDGSVGVLRQFDSLVRGGSHSYPTLAASPGRVAVSDTREDCYTEPEGLRDYVCDPIRIEYREAAPGVATSRSLEVCEHPTRPAPPHAIAVTDDAAAYLGCNADDAGALVVRSLSDPAGVPFVVEPSGGHAFDAVRMAGRYLAGELVGQGAGPILVVYDYVARTELYRVSGYSSDQGDFGLQADGTAAVVRADGSPPRGDCAEFGVEYYTPAEPFAHRVPGPACSRELALADGRLAYERYAAARPPRSQLKLVDLGGGQEVPVAATSTTDDRMWDLDASRVAYTDDTCTTYGGRVVVSSLEELRTTGFRAADSCPIGFARPRRVAERRNGVLAVLVACPRGCSATLDVVPLGRRTPHWQYDFTFPAGAMKTVTDIRLFYPQDTRRTIVSRRCAITLTAYQPDGTEKKVRIVRRLRISKHP